MSNPTESAMFATALRKILRTSHKVMMLDEIRDSTPVKRANTEATQRQVFTSVHCVDARTKYSKRTN